MFENIPINQLLTRPLKIQTRIPSQISSLSSEKRWDTSDLASNCVYACTGHTPEIVGGYFAALDGVFGTINECENGRDVFSLLKGPVCHAGFKRLN